MPQSASPLQAMNGRLAALAPAMLAVLRIGAGLLFMQHGAQKLFGVLGKEAVPLMSQLGFAGVVEFFGGLLIVVGLLTRPLALLSCLVMIGAYVVAHAADSIWPVINRGEMALLYALIFAYLGTAGAGPFSIDAWLKHRNER